MADSKKKNIIKLFLFAAVFLLIVIIASFMMTPTKWFDEKLIQDRNARIVQMMEQQENTIDIMNIGDSLSTAGFTPMELWRQQGFPSFNIGADGLRTTEAYFSVVEACNAQQPKYLLMESLFLFRYSIGQDMQMVLSQPIYHCFPFFKYHNIWKALVEGEGIMVYHKGYTINENVGEYEGEDEYLDLDLEKGNRTSIPAFNSFFFDRIKGYCDRRGIRIILYSMPSASNYNWDRIQSLENFSNEKGVEYIDLNQMTEEIGIDWESDTNDGGDHMNLFGATKVTSFLGDYLRKHGDLTDYRKDPKYESWNKELADYDQLVIDMEGKSYLDLWKEKKDKEWDEKYKKKDTTVDE